MTLRWRYSEFSMATLALACTATMTSVDDAWRPCRGPRCVSVARKQPILATRVFLKVSRQYSRTLRSRVLSRQRTTVYPSKLIELVLDTRNPADCDGFESEIRLPDADGAGV